MKRNQPNHTRITKNTPQRAHEELKRHYPLVYIFNENNMTYKGFSLKQIDEDKIAEVILLNDEPVQVRVLDEIPYVRGVLKPQEITVHVNYDNACNVKFGDF